MRAAVLRTFPFGWLLLNWGHAFCLNEASCTLIEDFSVLWFSFAVSLAFWLYALRAENTGRGKKKPLAAAERAMVKAGRGEERGAIAVAALAFIVIDAPGWFDCLGAGLGLGAFWQFGTRLQAASALDIFVEDCEFLYDGPDFIKFLTIVNGRIVIVLVQVILDFWMDSKVLLQSEKESFSMGAFLFLFSRVSIMR